MSIKKKKTIKIKRKKEKILKWKTIKLIRLFFNRRTNFDLYTWTLALT
jgi:hypothetical protein